MATPTTFLIPEYDNNIPNKINQNIEVSSTHTLAISRAHAWHFAIATNGFPSKKDGIYVYVTRIDNIRNGTLSVGFTDMATYDSTRSGAPGDELPGTSLSCYDGSRDPGGVPYFSREITRKASEVISILIISNNGTKKEVQWIIDGNDGPVQDCTEETKGFGNGDEIFPCVSLLNFGQRVTMIPFDLVKFLSPKIEELLTEFIRPRFINDALTSQLRDQIAGTHAAALTERDKQIQALKQQVIELRQQGTLKDKQLLAKDRQLVGKDQAGEKLMIEFRKELAAKDQLVARLANDFHGNIERCRIDLQLSHQQLELERAEHQKTRNLLHQIKMELKDVELYYLRLNRKESGQRRERESENNDEEEEFKVKQEPGLEDET